MSSLKYSSILDRFFFQQPQNSPVFKRDPQASIHVYPSSSPQFLFCACNHCLHFSPARSVVNTSSPPARGLANSQDTSWGSIPWGFFPAFSLLTLLGAHNCWPPPLSSLAHRTLDNHSFIYLLMSFEFYPCQVLDQALQQIRLALWSSCCQSVQAEADFIR